MTPKIALHSVALALAFLVSGSVDASTESRELVILYTNDFHSAIDPIPAYWLNRVPTPHLGGAAELMTLVEDIRARESKASNPVFLFDSGDMFTGTLSKLTQGEALMEMMITLGYDAFGIGNHEFDYGWRNFRKQMFRVPFPCLGANIAYAGTDVPFSQPHTILEKNGVRLGVIGIIGQDAKSVVLPSMVEGLEFTDPASAVRRSVQELENDVDLVVVLAHQGHTGPMQTDAEAHPELQRDFDADVRLVGEVPAIDVFIGGHAHRGIKAPYVHPDTGGLIVQTYGYGTRLGYLRAEVDTGSGRILSHHGELLKVWSDELVPNAVMKAKMEAYQTEVRPVIGGVVGTSTTRLIRNYNTESLLGAFSADVLRELTGADVAFMNAGGLRADLPQGEITVGHVQDAFPFYNTVVVLEMSGSQIRSVLEQGLTLLRGMIQVSGLVARYDLGQPVGNRVVSLSIGHRPVDDQKSYTVATNRFLAEGGDLYDTFTDAEWTGEIDKDIAEVVIDYLRQRERPLEAPRMDRLIPVRE